MKKIVNILVDLILVLVVFFISLFLVSLMASLWVSLILMSVGITDVNLVIIIDFLLAVLIALWFFYNKTGTGIEGNLSFSNIFRKGRHHHHRHHNDSIIDTLKDHKIIVAIIIIVVLFFVFTYQPGVRKITIDKYCMPDTGTMGIGGYMNNALGVEDDIQACMQHSPGSNFYLDSFECTNNGEVVCVFKINPSETTNSLKIPALPTLLTSSVDCGLDEACYAELNHTCSPGTFGNDQFKFEIKGKDSEGRCIQIINYGTGEIETCYRAEGANGFSCE